MSFDYINEAFKRLDALNEDVFDTSLTGLNNLSDFMDQDDASDIVKVIDPAAETEDAVSDSYIGKVIINCNVCHSHIFESKEDVVVDEDGVVNPEMQCPYCGEMSGFTVVGEIMPFEQSANETPDEENAVKVPEGDSAETEDPTEDPVVESAEKKLEEGFNSDTVMSDIETLKSFLRSKGHACKSKEAITYLWGVIDLFEAGDQELSPENIADWYQETCRNFPEDLALLEDAQLDELLDVNVDFDGSNSSVGVAGGSGGAVVAEDSLDEEFLAEGSIKDSIKKVATRLGADAATIVRCFAELLPGDRAYDVMSHIENKAVLKALMNGNEKVLNSLTMDDIEELKQDIEDYEKSKSGETLSESIDELSLTANGTHIEVDEDENGKVTLVAEPVEAEGDAVMAPVSDETVSEIAANNELEIEDPDAELPAEEIDVDMDEVDEEGLDELGESYLKNIYENVESFKTTCVSTTDSKMIVEGVITFQSGVKKTTGFVFEAYSASKDGKVKFVGKNEHFSSNNRAFALTGRISNNKLLPESLTYNYEVGSRKIVGTVNKQ